MRLSHLFESTDVLMMCLVIQHFDHEFGMVTNEIEIPYNTGALRRFMLTGEMEPIEPDALPDNDKFGHPEKYWAKISYINNELASISRWTPRSGPIRYYVQGAYTGCPVHTYSIDRAIEQLTEYAELGHRSMMRNIST